MAYVEQRNANGRLLCICGKPGTEFIHVEGIFYQGICSTECHKVWEDEKFLGFPQTLATNTPISVNPVQERLF